MELVKPLEVMTVAEVAAVLRISPQLCYQLVRDGRLKSVPCGRRVLIARSELSRFIDGDPEAVRNQDRGDDGQSI